MWLYWQHKYKVDMKQSAFKFFPCNFSYTVWHFYTHFNSFVLQVFFFILLPQCLLKPYRDLQCTIWYYLISVVVWIHRRMESHAKPRGEWLKCTSWSTLYGLLFFFLLKYGQFLANSQWYPGPNYYYQWCQEAIQS